MVRTVDSPRSVRPLEDPNGRWDILTSYVALAVGLVALTLALVAALA